MLKKIVLAMVVVTVSMSAFAQNTRFLKDKIIHTHPIFTTVSGGGNGGTNGGTGACCLVTNSNVCTIEFFPNQSSCPSGVAQTPTTSSTCEAHAATINCP